MILCELWNWAQRNEIDFADRAERKRKLSNCWVKFHMTESVIVPCHEHENFHDVSNFSNGLPFGHESETSYRISCLVHV